MIHEHKWTVENVYQLQTVMAMVVCLKDGCNTIKKTIGEKTLKFETTKEVAKESPPIAEKKEPA